MSDAINEALRLGRSISVGSGARGASVRYGTVLGVSDGRVAVEVDGGTVVAPCTTGVSAEAVGMRAVVVFDGSSATVLGVLGPAGSADAVTSQGYSESTGWTWRKWESGVAEAWKHFDTSDALTEQYGSFYYRTYESTLPFEFAEVPQPDGSVKCDTGLGFVCFNANTTTTKLGFMVCSPVAEAEGAKSISLDVRGRWK